MLRKSWIYFKKKRQFLGSKKFLALTTRILVSVGCDAVKIQFKIVLKYVKKYIIFNLSDNGNNLQ